MSLRIALPDQMVYEIDGLGLPPSDKVAFGNALTARLLDFPAQDGERRCVTVECCLGSCDLYASVTAMPVGADLVVLRWSFDALPSSQS